MTGEKALKILNNESNKKCNYKDFAIALSVARNALEKQEALKKWLERIKELDIEYNSGELAAILKVFTLK